MRSQEQLWLQYPLSSWSVSASGTASKRARWRAMALKRLIRYHIHCDGAPGRNDRAFQYLHVQSHAQAGGHGYGEFLNLSQLHGCGIVQAHVQGGGHGYVKASAHQANLHARGHGHGEVLADQQQQLEMRAQQHLKMFAQVRGQGYNETVAHQQGHVRAQVQGHQYGKTLAQKQQQQQQIWRVHGETLAQHQHQKEEPVAHRPVPKRLMPITVTRRSFSTNPRPTHFQNSIPIADTIQLTDLEFKIFNTLKAFLLHYDLRTQIRVAGGWVRDKLLGRQCGDIDITLDDMMGRTFCRKLSTYCRMVGMETTGFGVIKSNPTQAKHLEVAKMDILGVTIDFVNLRSPGYTESSSSPFTMQDFGTVVEDAFRRDLTINSLFYNIITERVEDPTGKGLFDLRSGIIATPLPPKVTFTDDPLRALRALRFGMVT